MDLPGSPPIPALVHHRVEAARRTTLRMAAATVEMVEHVLSALVGLQVDNCEIRVNQQELPGNDGSSRDAVEAILSAGIVAQDMLRSTLVIQEPLRIQDGAQWIEFHPSSGTTSFQVRYELDYSDVASVGRQTVEFDLTPDTYRSQIASARTFVTLAEANWLKSQGLGAHASYRDLLVFDDHGPIGNTLRFSDECARHKVLDLVGDFALAGCDFRGRVVAHRTGHRLNAAMVREVLKRHTMDFLQRKSA